MCEPASFIITKSKVIWSKVTDSHEQIRAEHQLPGETNPVAIRSVAVEIAPPNRDFNQPVEDWIWRVDQDLLPQWWDAAEARQRVRGILPEWMAVRVVRSGESRDVRQGEAVYVAAGGTVQAVYDGGTVQTYTSLDRSILRHASAVLIDRTTSPPVCYVGPQ